MDTTSNTEYAAEYERSLKYARYRTHADLRPFVEQAVNLKPGAGDDKMWERGRQDFIDHMGVLADYLQDADDPRSDIVRKYVDQVWGPDGTLTEHDPHQSHNHAMLWHPQIELQSHAGADQLWGEEEKTMTEVKLRPKAVKSRGRKPGLLSVHWPAVVRNPTKPGFTTWQPLDVHATLTPDEAREWADKLPDEHRDTVHKYLTTLFGLPKKKRK